MRKKYWAVLATAAALCVLGAAILLLPGDRQVIERSRSVAANAAPSEDGRYTCPVDFKELQAVNRDIYAWLYLPGTGINEPLVQRKDDSCYYLTHDSTGRKSESGALFTESAYNQKDFSDPATVIYGKNSARKRLFDGLQEAYSSPAGLEEHQEIIVYLPEEEIHYHVFAAVPFRSYHLLHYFDFSSEKRYRAFLQAVDEVKAIDANQNRAVTAEPGDPLLILATTRTGNPDMSYLVLAKRIMK